jgi:uncharacterized membrane protein
VLRLQVLLRNAAEQATSVADLPRRFNDWFVWWFALAVPAFSAVLGIYWLMVAKPVSIGS